MEKIVEKAKELKVVGSYDTVVAGGGIAGIAAALASARNGAKTLLCEREFILGGLGTAGLVTIYLPLCDGNGHQVSFGIAEELLRLSVKEGWEEKYPKAWLEGGSLEERKARRFEVRYNAAMFAILAERLLVSEGVDILYGTYIADTVTKNGFITHLIIESKSGRQAISVKAAVDCTGDADLCSFSGEDTALHGKGNILAAWYYYAANGKYDLCMHGCCDAPDVTLLENRRYSGVEGRELSQMVQRSHQEVYDHYIKRYGGIAENKGIASLATIPQVRMTRRLEGRYTMAESEAFCDFSDSVGLFSDWRKAGPVFALPFGTLIGKKVKNLTVAGRCISVKDDLWDVTRVIPVCAVSGQAAGTAAAMFPNLDTLDIGSLREKLRADGVKLSMDELGAL